MKKREPKGYFGEFKNVRLTLDERIRLDERLGQQEAADLIEELSGYIEGVRGADRRYKSHYAVVLNWARRMENENQARSRHQREIEARNHVHTALCYERGCQFR